MPTISRFWIDFAFAGYVPSALFRDRDREAEAEMISANAPPVVPAAELRAWVKLPAATHWRAVAVLSADGETAAEAFAASALAARAEHRMATN